MPSREQYIEWLDEVADPDRVSPWNAQRDFATITPEEIEALCNRVWNEAIEAAAKVVVHTEVGYGKWECHDKIRELKQGETK